MAMAFDADYFNHLVLGYRERRDLLAASLARAGFRFTVPSGAYYILADFSAISTEDDATFARRLARDVGVATVPGSSFYHDASPGRRFVRFAFCKKLETLEAAAARLATL